MINNEVINALKERRSIKKYLDKQISEEELSTILDAGTYAPTGRNRQSPQIVAVRNKETRDVLSKLNAEILGSETDPFYGAPCVIVVFADTTVNTGYEDACLVMGNLLNAAHAIGLGGCWIHRAKEVFESKEGRALMRKWGVNEKYAGVGNCILGYINGELPSVRPRRDGYIIKID